MNRRSFLKSAAVLASSAGVRGSGGLSSVWAQQPSRRFTATHYASPSGAGAHNGSRGNEWTLVEAYEKAVAGDRVQFAPGTYIVRSGSRRTQALTPRNSGTATQPIVFFAEHPAVYARDKPQLHSTWISDFKVNGVGSVTGHAERTPGGHYVVWDGLSMRQVNGAWNSGELGVVSLFGGSDLQVKFLRCLFDQLGQGQLEPAFNWGAVFIQSTTGIEFGDCVFQNIPGNLGDENAMPIVTYAAGELEIHHCEFRNNNGGSLWLKGQPAGNTHDNRPVRLHHCLHTAYGGLSLGFGGVGDGNIQKGQFFDLFQNIWHPTANGLGISIAWRDLSGGSTPRNVRMVNNTIVGSVPFDGGEEAVHRLQSIGDDNDVWRDCVFANNIVHHQRSNVAYISVQYGQRTNKAFQKIRMDHNCFSSDFKNYAGMPFGGWQKLGQDVHSFVGDPRFRSLKTGDFRLEANSPVRATGSHPGLDVLNLRGKGTAGKINMGAFVADDLSDIIGVRPEATTNTSPLVWTWPYAN